MQNKPEFFYWQGYSGLWWITTIFPLAPPDLNCPAVYILVRKDQFGKRTPLYIGQTEDLARRLGEHWRDRLLFMAIMMGCNELHVHLLAKTEQERLVIETDLRNGHATPLNRQPTRAA